MMSTVMGYFRWLAERTNAALVLIHHQRKGGVVGRQGDALRGHSSIEASLDLALQVIREEHSMECRIRSTKSRDVPFTEIGLEFFFTAAEDDYSLQTAGFLPRQLETGAGRKARAVEAIIETVTSANGGIAKTRLIHQVKDRHDGMPGINVLRGMVDELCESGELLGSWQGRKFIIQPPASAKLLSL